MYSAYRHPAVMDIEGATLQAVWFHMGGEGRIFQSGRGHPGACVTIGVLRCLT
jgi:hypothetical protein